MDSPSGKDNEPPLAEAQRQASLRVRTRGVFRRHWRAATLTAAALVAGGFLFMSLRPIDVEAVETRRGTAVDSVYASGVVEYVRQADVAPVVTSAIRTVRAAEGDHVRAGQTLAELADGPEQATAMQLAAQAAQAREAAGRTQRLFASGYAAKATRDDARRQYEAAEAAARAARERLLDYRIVAPFTGVVIRREAEPGDLARAGAALFVVANTTALRITADIDERDAGRVAEGMKALVRSDAFQGEQFDAAVSELTPQGDSTGRVFRARLSLAPGARLRPGMTVEANIIVAQRENAVLAPSTAIVGDTVWVLEGGKAHKQSVKLGAQGAALTEILQGAEAGQKLIANPPAALKDGARVSIRSKPESAP